MTRPNAATAARTAHPQSHLGSRWAGLPHAAQAIQITRRRKVKGKWSRQTFYAVTSLTLTQASYGYHARRPTRPLRTILTC